MNFPLPNEQGVACLVKVYDNFDNYKINDMVEFIGILSHDPSLAYVQDEHIDPQDIDYQSEKIAQTVNESRQINNLENSNETKLQNGDKSMCNCKNETSKYTKSSKVVLSSFPPSLVPRLHCIKFYHLKQNNPFLNKNRQLLGDSFCLVL